jgi:hypothetical protein
VTNGSGSGRPKNLNANFPVVPAFPIVQDFRRSDTPTFWLPVLPAFQPPLVVLVIA